MVDRRIILAALVLPLLAALLSITIHQRELAGSSNWTIPVSGYDPRDPLRGRYIAFRYDWELRGDAGPCLGSEGCDLCLSREAGQVVATAVAKGSACEYAVNVADSRLIVRPGFRNEAPALFRTRLFVSESSAPTLEAQLRAGPMAVEAQLGRDGRLIPRRLVPLP